MRMGAGRKTSRVAISRLPRAAERHTDLLPAQSSVLLEKVNILKKVI